MRSNGEIIIIIEDDEDDRLFLKDIFESLDYPNKIKFIEDPMDAFSYLSNSKVRPFLILSDINMPKINGFELREQILALTEIREKCTPYIFLSTSKNPENVLRAYRCQVQGYFRKEEDFSVYQAMIKNIVEYWRLSLTPGSAL
ncbi:MULTISPECIES: response regulator [Flavobacterium]|uniref:CheY-like chemotaxis protein n=2 Tax=Flavobacterium TaxID=237 RepID=A0A7W7N7V1_9FLAO|nr:MULTISPECIES: response regulator [Flavobacterium]MBB4801766.1 CheY-like chemotaxis protein [Flavobacterium nitrogenifigens]MBB6386724.1 CheY-like chemotaxis protein [Flavobacterium notoginsengisoli]